MTRRHAFALLFAAAAQPASGALGAEMSRAEVLGFSENGSVFAFQEYGIADGIGGAYASFFAIDVASDTWLDGTPIHLTPREGDDDQTAFADGQAMSQEQIDWRLSRHQRRKLMKLAAPILREIGPLHPPEQRVVRAPQDFTDDSRVARFSNLGFQTRYNTAPDTRMWRVDLTEINFPKAENCFDFFEGTKGYKLTLTNETTGVVTVLNQDKRVPKSRGCPQSYSIEQILTYGPPQGPFSLAVLVRYGRLGFEGLDGRLLAVTARVSP